jgi:uncharacterized protein DUF222/HNH endonuclease
MAAVIENSVSPGFQMGQDLIRMRHAIDLQELAFAKLAAQFAETDYWDEDGSVSPIDWIRINCHMTQNTAAGAVAVGEKIPELVHSVAAMVYGDVGFAHLPVMARTAEALGDRFHELLLLEQARECSPGKFFHVCRHYRHSMDARGYLEEQENLAGLRRLHLSTAEDGCLLIHGELDPVGGAAVRNALEPLARKSGRHDDRSPEMRMADALVELASGSQTVQLQVTSSVETLLGLVGAPGAEMQFSLPISSKTVERFACDCSISRILLQDSLVIDVGRSKRTAGAPVRRALDARDGHCRWPGCERPAKWSAAHHVVHWIHGGATDLDNLVLLCHRHHRMVHEGGWQVVKSDDGQILTIPPTITFGPRPRGPD